MSDQGPPVTPTHGSAGSEYEQRLLAARKSYPFDRWRTYALDQYTPENCDAAQRIFDDLLSRLVALAESASPKDKVACFRTAVEALNELNARTEIIETGERESLCDLIDEIARSAGLNPEDYGVDGLASEWREW